MSINLAVYGQKRSRTYGAQRISLAKRAGHRGGWSRGELNLYGKTMEVCYKTFLATYKPAGGLIRVVLVRETEGSWRAYLCTDPNARVAEILEAVADRAAIEQDFHDLKEVHGAGQQQVRNYWANIAVYHLTMWLHTLIELWAWRKPASLSSGQAPRSSSHVPRELLWVGMPMVFALGNAQKTSFSRATAATRFASSGSRCKARSTCVRAMCPTEFIE